MIVALLFLAAAPAAQPYPAEAVLGAFRKACDDTRKFHSLERALPKKGWAILPPGQAPQIDQLVAKGQEALKSDDRLEGKQYSRAVAGRTLYLVTTKLTDSSGIWATGCRVYDPEAKTPVGDEILIQWMKKPPTHREDLPNGGVVRKWEPGWRSGISVDVDFAGHGGEFNTQYGLSGVVMIAQSIGGF